MRKRTPRDIWNVVGSVLVPAFDRRSGTDRRGLADRANDSGAASGQEHRRGERRQLGSVALLYVSALFISPQLIAENVRIQASKSYVAESIQLRADIEKPEGQGPFPAVVLMHGCGGWQPAVRYAMQTYADFLVKHGFVVLDLDSFGPRYLGGGKVCESVRQQRNALDYRTHDAYDALKYLRTLDYVDGDNIFLMGQSNGGSVAINVAKGDAANDLKESSFKAVAAYYPWCGSFGGREVALEIPLMIFAGGQDDWTPAHQCEGVKSTGAVLEKTIYPQAAHSFDLEIQPQRYLGNKVGHDKEAAADSRARMLAFFIEHTSGRD